MLLHSNDVIDSVVALGAIPLLLALIGDGSAAQEQAVGALRNLSSSHEKHLVELVKAGSIPPLLAVLSAGSVRAKEDAVATLRNISTKAQLRICMAKAGAVPVLVKLERGRPHAWHSRSPASVAPL